MKKVLILLFILLSVNNTILHADENKEIELMGNFSNQGTRSLLSPVSAINYPDYIQVSFSKLLGEISVRIYDEANDIVYEEIIDASTQNSLLISTVFLEKGTYRIEFTNLLGRNLGGNFVIE